MPTPRAAPRPGPASAVLRALPLLASGALPFPTNAADAAGAAWSGYAEAYGVAERKASPDGQRAGFLYNFDRARQPEINLALLRGTFDGERLRGAGAVGVGTYMEANYAAEPEGLRNVYEAWVGLTFGADRRVFADVGVFPSHIGFESAIGVDNATLTRSLAAENSPYFESGLRVGWSSADGHWSVTGLVLNGWQRIRRPDGHEPAFGHQLTWTPNERWLVNSSSFIGSDRPRDQRRIRYFHNLYVTAKLDPNWQVTAGFDLGLEEATAGGGSLRRWSVPQLVVRRQLGPETAVAARLEGYRDPTGVIVSPTGNGLDVWGLSANIDRRLGRRFTWRTGLRVLSADAPTFATREGPRRRDNLALTMSIAVDAGDRVD